MENSPNVYHTGDKLISKQKSANNFATQQKIDQIQHRNKLTFRLPQPQIQHHYLLGEDTPYKSDQNTLNVSQQNLGRRSSYRQSQNISALSKNVSKTLERLPSQQVQQQQQMSVQQKLSQILSPNSPKIKFNPSSKQNNIQAIFNMLKTQKNINGSPSGKKGEVQYIKNRGDLSFIKQQHQQAINQGKRSNGVASRNRSIIYHALTEKDSKSIPGGGIDGGLQLKMAAVNRATAAFSAYQQTQSKAKRFNEDLSAFVQASVIPLSMSNESSNQIGITASGLGPITSKIQIDEYLNSQHKYQPRQSLRSAYSNARSRGKIVINNFYSYSSNGGAQIQQEALSSSFYPQMSLPNPNSLDPSALAKDLRADLYNHLMKLSDLQVIQTYASLKNTMNQMPFEASKGDYNDSGSIAARMKRPRSVVYSLSGQRENHKSQVSAHLKQMEDRLIAQAASTSHEGQKTPPLIVLN